jgi:prophage regulatory protein
MSKDQAASAPPRLLRIIRWGELPLYAGLRRTVIADMIAAGTFPKPIKLNDNGRAVGWLEHELVAWQQSRIAARDNAA